MDSKDGKLGEKLEHIQIVLSIEMRRLRKREGLSQKELAERMEVDKSYVSDLENAHIQSSFEELLKYLIALDADFILGFLKDEEFRPVSESAESWFYNLEVEDRDTIDKLSKQQGRIYELEKAFKPHGIELEHLD